MQLTGSGSHSDWASHLGLGLDLGLALLRLGLGLGCSGDGSRFARRRSPSAFALQRTNVVMLKLLAISRNAMVRAHAPAAWRAAHTLLARPGGDGGNGRGARSYACAWIMFAAATACTVAAWEREAWRAACSLCRAAGDVLRHHTVPGERVGGAGGRVLHLALLLCPLQLPTAQGRGPLRMTAGSGIARCGVARVGVVRALGVRAHPWLLFAGRRQWAEARIAIPAAIVTRTAHDGVGASRVSRHSWHDLLRLRESARGCSAKGMAL